MTQVSKILNVFLAMITSHIVINEILIKTNLGNLESESFATKHYVFINAWNPAPTPH